MESQQSLRFPYGIPGNQTRKCSAGDGALSCKSGLLSCCSGAQAGAMSMLQGTAPVYISSESVAVHFTAKFDANPVPGSLQVVGLGDNENGVFVGYNGAQFGVAITFGGSLQFYFVAFSGSAAATGSFSVQLNGSSYSISCSAGDGVQALMADLLGAGLPGYLLYPGESGVWVMSLHAGPSSGNPSFSSGTGGVSGNVTLMVQGSTGTTSWALQGAWNGGTIPPSLSWSDGNTFMVRMNPLGFGAVQLYVSNPTNGDLVLMHTFSARNTATNFYIPNGLWPAIYSQNLGAAGSVTASTTGFTVDASSVTGYLQCQPSFSCAGVAGNVGTSPTKVLTITNGLLMNGLRNRRTAMLRTLYVAGAPGVQMTLGLYLNAALSAPLASPAVAPDSSVLVDASTNATCSGTPLRQWVLPGTILTLAFDLEKLCLPPLTTLTVALSAGSPQSSTGIGVTLSWVEG